MEGCRIHAGAVDHIEAVHRIVVVGHTEAGCHNHRVGVVVGTGLEEGVLLEAVLRSSAVVSTAHHGHQEVCVSNHHAAVDRTVVGRPGEGTGRVVIRRFQ